MQRGILALEDGSEFRGKLFGAERAVAGEVVFSTGMVGYPESMTDPSYAGQILAFTYPLVGNYGVPAVTRDEHDLPLTFESERIHTRAIVVSTLSSDTCHHSAERSLAAWMVEAGVPGLVGVDTRALTKRLRTRGTMLGRITTEREQIAWRDPNASNLVATVSINEPREYGQDGPRVVVVDTGCKTSILRALLRAKTRVLRVPWDYDFFDRDFDGILLPNGPGDPKMVERTIAHARRALEQQVPIFGVCLGAQILALAAGADTYKMRFGHRSQNQPCAEIGTRRCYVTTQNHGYAINSATLPDGWHDWFVNVNDLTSEGIRHDGQLARGVQFHPEAAPGPTDTAFLFESFTETLR
jgi:carbamoyl-phosphate synthase small subunit